MRYEDQQLVKCDDDRNAFDDPSGLPEHEHDLGVRPNLNILIIGWSGNYKPLPKRPDIVVLIIFVIFDTIPLEQERKCDSFRLGRIVNYITYVVY